MGEWRPPRCRNRPGFRETPLSDSESQTHLKIQGLDRYGRGLSTFGGQRVTIPGTLPDEVADVTLYPRNGRVWGRVLDLQAHASDRVPAACEFDNICPGCTMRHVSPRRQISIYEQTVRAALRRRLDVGPLPIEFLGHAGRDHYRTRAIARALVTKSGALRLGIVGYQDTIPLSKCAVQTHRVQALLSQLESELGSLGLRYYDSETRTGEIRHIVVDAYQNLDETGLVSERVVICLGRPLQHEWTENTFLADQQGTAVAYDILPFRRPGTFKNPVPLRHGLSVHFRVGPDVIKSTLPAWCPQSPNTVQVVQDTLLDWLSPKPNETIVEVGCGSGTNTLALARRSKMVIGLDNCRAAVSDARHNLDGATVSNASIRLGTAERGIGRIGRECPRLDKAVCHGMRVPFGPRAMAQLSSLKPKTIVMIGPSPNSLAADIRELRKYRIQRYGIVDQTPGTPLVLSMVQLHRISD
ncbi:MAG: hypothetical protein CMH52_04175 [Myxococcales bacterium]|nr:hypothetical protein [Myxococcales bacterium]